ncbi:Kelch repeat-containing protein [Corallincola platygyrae]|uniref:Kelch repeat-containing protein n=1 Tax=Corallincola platygyrae TaxID=1193278 RepID=A0ABW4XTH7_9GAMM
MISPRFPALLSSLFIAGSLISQPLSAKEAELPPLPEPVANNAIAKVETKRGTYFISLMGLGKGKTYKDVHARGWRLALNDHPLRWQPTKPVPASLELSGRLASIAVSLPGELLLFGGYTVAADHSEISSPDVYSYKPDSDTYVQLPDMPTPVDDAVALTYQDKYIYLISGWHNHGNVNLVQLFNRETKQWSLATPFPGAPVFGHAGGIVDNQLVICDGVKVAAVVDGKRQFAAERACYQGTISTEDPAEIHWQALAHFDGEARYRMAAVGAPELGGILFVGGSTNPYNYEGIGYDGVPAPASAQVDLYEFATGQWKQLSPRTVPSMDHRGLLFWQGQYWTLGGMNGQQQVIDTVIPYLPR